MFELIDLYLDCPMCDCGKPCDRGDKTCQECEENGEEDERKDI